MKKIPTIFKRNPKNMREILDEPHPDCLWVFNGEGVATRKYDGTCVAIINGVYMKRREVKRGKKAPSDFIQLMEDKNTGKRVGWVPVKEDDPQDKWHMAAFDNQPDGTYELCGPKVQGNPEGLESHTLIPHSEAEVYPDCPRDYHGLKSWLKNKNIEGVVFHHPDGRMAKIKKRDFGLPRKPQKNT